ncbi:MAG: adenine deaminase, partial [Deltaproteobacteria bacterium]|nr:adenine deaminase [Deltaproteobacteria bacterium]
MTKENLSGLLAAARGDQPADLLLTGGKVADLFGVELIEAQVAVKDGWIVGLGPGYEARQTVDVQGGVIAPALIDGHLHLESTLLCPPALAQVLVPWGTGALVADPHEIANVLGLAGIDYLLAASRGLDLDIFFLAPSCVPASHLETSGAKLEASDLAPLAKNPRVLGLAEVMNFPGLAAGQPGL